MAVTRLRIRAFLAALGGFVALACTSPAQRHLERAHALLHSATPEAERPALEAALATAGNDDVVAARAHLLLAIVALHEERWAAAHQHTNAGLERCDPRDQRRHCEQLQAALRRAALEVGEPAEAASAHDALMASLEVRPAVVRWADPSRSRALAEAEYGRELAVAGYPEAALEAFRRAEARNASYGYVGAATARWLRAKAGAMIDVGRESDGVALLAELEERHADSDYVENALFGNAFQAIVARWPREAMPIRVSVTIRGRHAWPDRADAVRITRDAYAAWSNVVADGVPSFAIVEDASEAQIRVSWARVSNDEWAAGWAHSKPKWEDGIIRQSTVKLRSRIGEHHISEARAREILMHEFGHALGLLGHSPVVDDLMYPALQRDIREGPSERDLRTLRRLYAAPIGDGYVPSR